MFVRYAKADLRNFPEELGLLPFCNKMVSDTGVVASRWTRIDDYFLAPRQALLSRNELVPATDSREPHRGAEALCPSLARDPGTVVDNRLPWCIDAPTASLSHNET